MTCPCGNLQCYVCGKSIKDYRHFETPGPNGQKCLLHDDTETRLETKILNAREEATKKVLEDGGLQEEDVKVEMEKRAARRVGAPPPPGRPPVVMYPPMNGAPVGPHPMMPAQFYPHLMQVLPPQS